MTMHAEYLLPEIECRTDGSGPVVEAQPTECRFTLGITEVTERDDLEVSIWGSSDGENWGPRPLAEFPRKSYCGRYSLVVDLSKFPSVRQLRASWKIRDWTHDERDSQFGFYVQFAGSGEKVLAAGA